MTNNMERFYNDMQERYVIGGLMFKAETIDAAEAISILRPDDFYLAANRQIWEVICELSGKGQHIDFVTVCTVLDNRGIELSSYVMAAANEAPSQASLVSYANEIKKMSRMRKALCALTAAQDELFKFGDPEERMQKALDAVSAIGQDETDADIKDPVQVMSNVFEIMERAYTNKTGLIGISSGLENIDAFTQGFQSPDIIVVAAPPSMGKTTFSLNFAEYAAFLDPVPRKVLFFSLEMSAEQLMQKTIANLGSLYLKKIKSGRALDDSTDMGRLAKAQEIIQKRKDYYRIDDKAGQTIGEIKARAKRTSMKMGGLDLIVVDYLHLIEATNKNDGDIQVITKNLQGLKQLAKQLKCPVIVLSQLNRGFTGRPEMKNLLGSSIIEQTADIIFFLYDEDYQGTRGDHSLTEVIIAKNRMGETGSTFLQPELGLSRFVDTKRLPEPKEPEVKKYTSKRYDQ